MTTPIVIEDEIALEGEFEDGPDWEKVLLWQIQKLGPDVCAAWLALQRWAELNHENMRPTGRDVETFAKLYGVPRDLLGGLVGVAPLLSADGARNRRLWIDFLIPGAREMLDCAGGWDRLSPAAKRGFSINKLFREVTENT